MAKLKRQSKPKALIIVAILLVAIMAFFALGGISKTKRIYYGYVVRQAYHKEYGNLGSALEGLGVNENKDIKSKCEVTEIATDGVNTSEVLFCGLQTDNYVEITESNKQQVLNAAKQLDELTTKNGGKLQTNIAATFSKYLSDIANGVDYNPDFGATFVRGNYLCAVHLNVAYSNPKPPAYSIQFGCNSPRVTQDDNYLSPPDGSSNPAP